ncbi:MAG: 2-succinyl-5-enolpyruvyl-6-hydroxy-3-cyclohexene-1-carboxylate synthase [Winogradskyella sp.]|uniref:2-succinyl-5-enolpyruvyl-6-hydroxy-3- cyclohexene-1-carboxylate synthase n=1 Tax=Winogradskyella sp. TaxID=1883156 RepID=UPI0017A0382A|nr:2-succinyl-5-enolpyruvyl-6-hydroxy-3-cyclohexene-1-carboxylate synthase [Winogradskyella sp.]
MKYSQIPLSQTVVTLCKTHNIKHVVISPGSRNAPLTIGFTHDDYFECYSIVDERCAAFFALGIAQQLREPVAVVCTSGSALLNYFPAVSEAFYSNIPIVVLSADRPEHLVGIGDGQTIHQKNVYGNHVVYSTSLKLDLKEDEYTISENELPIFKSLDNKKDYFLGLQNGIQSYNESEIDKALNHSKLKAAPVHINIPFDEPLYQTVDSLTINPKPFNLIGTDDIVDQVEINTLFHTWQNADRKMILVGVLQPNAIEEHLLQKLADDESVIVFTETTSNIYHPDFFPGIDKIIAPLDDDDFKLLQPEILLTFGGLIVSKKIKAFLRNYKPKQHWHVDLYKANDTFFCLEKHVELSINTFLNSFLSKITENKKSNYKAFWLSVRDKRRQKHEAYLKTIPFTDFTVFNKLLYSLPKESQLQLGNSSTIRYAQLFQLKKEINVFCNRGTSGIDGSTSTAIGSAAVSKERVTFITGDLSFFYDSNALWNSYMPNNFRIIVINNGGGGIFRILPGHKNTENFDTYFETKHSLTAKHLCNMYGLEYNTASNDSTLLKHLKTFYDQSEQPKLLEIFTPSRINDEILLQYFNFIK